MKQNRTLTLVDFQNDFVAPQGALTFDAGAGDMPLINRMAVFFEQLRPCVFDSAIITYDTHQSATYKNTQESKQFPPHCLLNTSGWNLAVDVERVKQKIPVIQHLKKDTYDMWKGSPEGVCSSIVSQTKEVVLIGVASDICNRAAMEGWLKNGASVIILEDLTRGIFKQTPQIIAEPSYATAVASGQLKMMNSRSFLQNIQNQRRRA